jgi:hypothetical protein
MVVEVVFTNTKPNQDLYQETALLLIAPLDPEIPDRPRAL